MGERQHLHRDDVPGALAVLAAVMGNRRPPEGYEPTIEGAWVDWDGLEHSWLSSTEVAAVIVARGIAAAERQGGWSTRLSHVIATAITGL